MLAVSLRSQIHCAISHDTERICKGRRISHHIASATVGHMPHVSGYLRFALKASIFSPTEWKWKPTIVWRYSVAMHSYSYPTISLLPNFANRIKNEIDRKNGTANTRNGRRIGGNIQRKADERVYLSACFRFPPHLASTATHHIPPSLPHRLYLGWCIIYVCVFFMCLPEWKWPCARALLYYFDYIKLCAANKQRKKFT